MLTFGPRMARAMIDGHFVPLQGAVYEALSPDIWDDLNPSEHVIDYDPEKFRHLPTHLAVDPGFRCSAWIWIHEHTDEEGQPFWVVFDQIMPDRMGDEDCIAMVNRRNWPIDLICVDPAAEAMQSTSSYSTMDMLAGVKTRGGPMPVATVPQQFRHIPVGVNRLRALLGGQGLPVRIFFARRMKATEDVAKRGLLRSLLSYVYPDPDKRTLSRLDMPFKDNVNDHGCDALRYWAIIMWLQKPELRRMLEENSEDPENLRRWERAV